MRKLTTPEWIVKAQKTHGDQYDYTDTVYVRSTDHVLVNCPEHGQWSVQAKAHLKGNGCRKCGHRKSREAQLDDTPTFIKKAKAVHGDRYDYSKVDYMDAKTDVIIICNDHGDFTCLANLHLLGKKCPRCPRKQRTTNEFTEMAKAVHGDRYDYSKVDYETQLIHITIGCPTHGDFKQRPTDHLGGKGCKVCGQEKSISARTGTNTTFIKKAKEVHGDRYDYSKVDYINAIVKVCIIIKKTGEEFWQQPNNHLSGRKSLIERDQVASEKYTYTTDQFIGLANERHPTGFDYSQSHYTGSRDEIIISCDKHGPFSTLPMYHLQNDGCPRCTTRVSKPEQEVFDFVSQYVDDIEQSNRSIIKPKELDMVIQSRNMAIEFCGIYHHSTKFGKPANYHLTKHVSCEDLGIRLITIFDDEWRDKRHIVEDTLRHFMGASEKGVGARKTTIREIEWKEAKAFLNDRHLMGAGQSGNYRIGAFDGDELISVMVFGFPSDERGIQDTIEMKRFVTNGKNNAGVGSKMFKHAVREMGYKKVMAFIDRRWFTGSFKSIAGFEVVSVTQPSKYWTNGNVRKHRRFKTKAGMLKSGEATDPSLTKERMLADLGYYSIYDCGKVKVEWTAE
jgi:hypothetical protein